MITDPDHIEGLIDSTASLIEHDGMDISLSRNEWVTTAAGGTRPGSSVGPLPSVRRFFGAVTTEPLKRTREEGEFLILDHVLIGMPDDDIKKHDTFMVSGRKFEVMDIDPDDSWQRKGWCTERA